MFRFRNLYFSRIDKAFGKFITDSRSGSSVSMCKKKFLQMTRFFKHKTLHKTLIIYFSIISSVGSKKFFQKSLTSQKRILANPLKNLSIKYKYFPTF